VTAHELDYIERRDRLRLARTPRIGPVTFARLLGGYETATAVLDVLPELARNRGAAAPVIPSIDAVDAEFERIEQAGAEILLLGDTRYPTALACIPDPPPALIIRGRSECLDAPACAIVGSRNASAAGLRFARELASGLGDQSVTIISGLARGIDGAAHKGALESGTIAVLAGGIDHIYPPEHGELHQAIAEQGLLVSEMPLGTSPTARDFPRRNRIISGLSLGTIIVEAAMRSGSLITARFAGEQGREVMAVPGSPLDPRAKGTNRLLRDGAHLIETPEDALAILNHCPSPHRPPGLDDVAEPPISFGGRPELPEGPEQIVPDPGVCAEADDPVERLRNLLSPTPVSADELARQARLPIGIVQATVMEFELSGDAIVLPGGLIQTR
jgi:DNA processing protein